MNGQDDFATTCVLLFLGALELAAIIGLFTLGFLLAKVLWPLPQL
jgi:hypothetical protein